MSEAIRCDVCGEFADQDFGNHSNIITIPVELKQGKKNLAISVKMLDAEKSNAQNDIFIDQCFNCTIIALNEYRIDLTKLFKSYNE